MRVYVHLDLLCAVEVCCGLPSWEMPCTPGCIEDQEAECNASFLTPIVGWSGPSSSNTTWSPWMIEETPLLEQVCAAVQVTGFVLCLHGAARITHRAQRIVSFVSQWHAVVTCEMHNTSEPESENMATESHAIDVDGMCFSPNESESDVESVADACTIVPSKYEFSSFQKRQALGE
eukprot:Gb_03249 [translate_table: standard]